MDGYKSGLFVKVPLQKAFGLLFKPEDLCGNIISPNAGISGDQFFTVFFQQINSMISLQLIDTFRNGRLGNTEAFGSIDKAAVFYHHVKHPELI